MQHRKLTYANVMATIAVFLSLGGGALAARHLIDGHSIKRRTLPGDRLRRGSVTGKEIRTSTLGLQRRLAGGCIGRTGIASVRADGHPRCAFVIYRVGDEVTGDVSPGFFQTADARCRAGETALSWSLTERYLNGSVVSASPEFAASGTPVGFSVSVRMSGSTAGSLPLQIGVLCAA